MRLWHPDLIPVLPREQLLAQWRELNSIFVKQDRHILINYIYDYSKPHLLSYTNKVINEMYKRGYNINSFDNLYYYFGIRNQTPPFTMFNYNDFLGFAEHDDEYFMICYYNLKEKYMRYQKGFTTEIWNKIEKVKEDKACKIS